MSFAPTEGVSATTSMLARVPVLPQSLLTRMSSMARSNHTLVNRRHDVNGEFESGSLRRDHRNASQPTFMLLWPQSGASLRLLPGLKSGGWGFRPGQAE